MAAMQDAAPTLDIDAMTFTFTHMAPGADSWTGGAGGPGDIGRVTRRLHLGAADADSPTVSDRRPDDA